MFQSSEVLETATAECIDSFATTPRHDPHQADVDTPQPHVGSRYLAQIVVTSLPLLLGDLIAIGTAVLIAFGLAELFVPGFHVSPLKLLAFLTMTAPLGFAVFKLYPAGGMHPMVEFRQCVIATLLVFVAFVTASLVHDGRQGYLKLVATCCVFSMIAVPFMRSAVRSLFSRCRWWGQPVLIFGSGATPVEYYKHLSSHPELGMRPIGIVDDRIDRIRELAAEFVLDVGTLDQAPALARRHSAFWAMIAMPERTTAEIREMLEKYAKNIPHLQIMAETGSLPTLWNCTCDSAGSVAIQIRTELLLPWTQAIKRVMDVAIVLAGAPLVLPLAAAIAVLIKIGSPGRVLYSHERLGRAGRRINVWKFRTMFVNADQMLEQHLQNNLELRREWEETQKLRNDPRVTSIGRILRKTSLDELPQIWNVLMGDMSLVGPRPIVDIETARYGNVFTLYQKVRPGITGLWQISGRNNTTYDERVRFDEYYVLNWSPWVDAFILLKTVRVVLLRDGAY